jgi:hypothetical protein
MCVGMLALLGVPKCAHPTGGGQEWQWRLYLASLFLATHIGQPALS